MRVIEETLILKLRPRMERTHRTLIYEQTGRSEEGKGRGRLRETNRGRMSINRCIIIEGAEEMQKNGKEKREKEGKGRKRKRKGKRKRDK